MSEMPAAKPYTLEPGDKVTAVAVYTAQSLLIGELVTREAVRVSTWLRTLGLPDYAALYGVTMLRFLGTGEPQVLRLPELYFPMGQVIALHLAPPATDPLDYDPTEQNRKFELVSALAGPFRFDGSLRMPGHLTLTRQMELLRDPFTMLYDVAVSSAFQPMGVVQTSMVLLRPSAFTFAARKPA
ncbi:MAG: hypothetical protein HY899_10275 [Deltaproteobacteria bacterium]|nr:hypothetical protein [Deltaproteobacteria bacterium]